MAQQSSPVRAVLFLGIALVAAGAALVVVYQLFQNYQDAIQTRQRPERSEWYLVALTDLYQGITITEDDLFAIQIPPKYLHLNGGPESGLFQNPDEVVGRVPKERILSNEFIRTERLADPDSATGMNALVPRGMRAVSIQLGGGRSLQGHLEPGNYVDILWTHVPYGEEIEQTDYLLQAVMVLGVDDRSKPGEDLADVERRNRRGRAIIGTVTVSVTPAQAEKLVHAQHTGEISMSLRNDLDVESFWGVVGLDTRMLFGLEEEKVPQPVRRKRVPKAEPEPEVPKPSKIGVIVVEGARETTFEFDDDEPTAQADP